MLRCTPLAPLSPENITVSDAWARPARRGSRDLALGLLLLDCDGLEIHVDPQRHDKHLHMQRLGRWWTGDPSSAEAGEASGRGSRAGAVRERARFACPAAEALGCERRRASSEPAKETSWQAAAGVKHPEQAARMVCGVWQGEGGGAHAHLPVRRALDPRIPRHLRAATLATTARA